MTTQTLNNGGGYNTSVTVDDSLGRARQTQDPTPQGGRLITDTFYDSRGWVLKTNNAYWDPTAAPVMPAGALPGSADNAVPNQDDYVYDGLGRVVQDLSENDADVVSTTTTVYSGDETTVIPPAGGTVKTTETDPLGQTSAVVEYTDNPVLTTPTDTFTGTWYITPAANSTITTTYAYDAAGNQAQITDENGEVWSSSYDLLGEKISGTDPDAGTSTMSYDLDGRLEQTEDAEGNYVSYTYDQDGRKTGEYDSAAGSAQVPYVSTTSPGTETAAWVYDDANGVSGVNYAIGQITTSSSFSGGYAYIEQNKGGFNNSGEPLGISVTIPSVQGSTLGKTWTITYTYTGPNGLLGSTSYPAGGGLPLETTTPSYTAGLYLPSGLGSSLTNDGYDNGTTYTAYSQVESTILGNGTDDATVTDAYDPHSGLITDQDVTRNITTPSTVDDTGYTYNLAGQLTSETDTRLGATATAETQCFTYTTQSQLSQAWTATDNCAATPSSSSHTTVGDLLSADSAYDETWTYNTTTGPTGAQASETSYSTATGASTIITDGYGVAGAQPTTLTQATPGAGTPDTYGYDADGQQKTRSTSLGAQNLAWNNDGTLQSVTNTTTSSTSSYIYDADGNLLIQEDPGTTTLYLPGEQIAYNTTAQTAAGNRYYPLPGGATAVRTGTGTSYKFEISSDQHATNTLYLNSTCQNPTWRQQDPYGNTRGTATTWIDNRGFLNDVDDTATGLTLVGARWYDPTTGSFISLDPVLEATDPTQLAGYDYAGNDPASASDPTGEVCAEAKSANHDGDVCGGDDGGGSDDGSGGGSGDGGDGATPADTFTKDWILNGYTNAHRTAQALLFDYLLETYGTDASVSISYETAIPGGGPNGGTGYADVVMIKDGVMYIWEVKHGGYGAEDNGPGEVNRYVRAENKFLEKTGESQNMVAEPGFNIPGVQGPVPVMGSANERLVAYSSKKYSGSGVYVYDVTDENGNKKAPRPTSQRFSLQATIQATASFTLLFTLKGATEAWQAARAGTVDAELGSAEAAEGTLGVTGTAGDLVGDALDVCDVLCDAVP